MFQVAGTSNVDNILFPSIWAEIWPMYEGISSMSSVWTEYHFQVREGSNKIKQLFLGAQRWTHHCHPYKLNRRFNGEEEYEDAPRRQSSTDILSTATARENYLNEIGSGQRRIPDGLGDPYRRHGVRRRSSLYNLLYWQVHYQSYTILLCLWH